MNLPHKKTGKKKRKKEMKRKVKEKGITFPLFPLEYAIENHANR